MYCILAVLLSRESEGRRREQDWCKSGKWLLPTGERAGANPQPLLSFSLFRPEEEANPKPSAVKSGGRGESKWSVGEWGTVGRRVRACATLAKHCIIAGTNVLVFYNTFFPTGTFVPAGTFVPGRKGTFVPDQSLS